MLPSLSLCIVLENLFICTDCVFLFLLFGTEVKMERLLGHPIELIDEQSRRFEHSDDFLICTTDYQISQSDTPIVAGLVDLQIGNSVDIVSMDL